MFAGPLHVQQELVQHFLSVRPLIPLYLKSFIFACVIHTCDQFLAAVEIMKLCML